MFSLINPNISAQGAAFALILLPFILAAVVWQFRATKQGLEELFAYHLAAAVLGLFYFAAYVILVFTNVSQSAWALWVRPMGFILWPLVWTWPALVSIRLARKLQGKVRKSHKRELAAREETVSFLRDAKEYDKTCRKYDELEGTG